MNKSRLLGAVCACLVVISFNTNASLIDFEDLGVLPGNQISTANFATITSGGFDFTPGSSFITFADMHVSNNHGNTVGSTTELSSHGDLLMTENGGGTFDLVSFLLGSAFIEIESFTVVGTLSGGGTVSQTFNLDGNTATLELFNLNSSFTSLIEVNWLHLGGNQGIFNVDNILVDNIIASAVPVPPALWLFGSGLLGLVGMARRRKA